MCVGGGGEGKDVHIPSKVLNTCTVVHSDNIPFMFQ